MKRTAVDTVSRDALVEAHTKLVYRIAHRILPGCPSGDVEDVIQVGLLSLIESAATYDPSRGRFSTFAGWHAARRMFLAIEQARRVTRVPPGVLARSTRPPGEARVNPTALPEAAWSDLGAAASGAERAVLGREAVQAARTLSPAARAALRAGLDAWDPADGPVNGVGWALPVRAALARKPRARE